MSEIKLDNFYHLEYSDYCLQLYWYILNVLADVPFGLLLVFLTTAEKIFKKCSLYDIRTIFRSGLTLRKYLFQVKPPTEYNIIKNCVYPIPCSCGKVCKGETWSPLKVRLCWGEIKKFGIADHIKKEKGSYLHLWHEIKIIEKDIGE